MIRFSSVYFRYRKDEPVLEGVDFEIASGLTLVLGPNGSGKSTLLKIAAGVERPDRGTVAIEAMIYGRMKPLPARISLTFRNSPT